MATTGALVSGRVDALDRRVAGLDLRTGRFEDGLVGVHVRLDRRAYSFRSASIGSAPAALRAGM